MQCVPTEPLYSLLYCPFSSQSNDSLVAEGAAGQLYHSVVSGGGRKWSSPQSSLIRYRSRSADPDVVLGGQGRTPSQDEVGTYLQALEEQLVELKELTGMEEEAAA